MRSALATLIETEETLCSLYPLLTDDEFRLDQLEKISAQLDEAKKQLDQLKSNPGQTDSLKKAIEQLEEAQKALKEARDKTG